jgi:O-antigen/teichoic acid export membrane protein
MYIQLIKQGIEKVRSSANIKKYIFNTSWLFVEKVFRLGVGLVVGIWIARYLGPEKFGLLNYAQSMVALFAAISTLGLDNIVIRELVKDKGRDNVLLGTSFILKLVGGFAVLGILFNVMSFSGDDAYTQMLVLLVATSTIFQSFNVIDFYFQSKVDSKYVVYAGLFMLCLNTPLKIILLIYDAPLEAFAFAYVAEFILTAIGLVYFYHQQKHSILKWRFKWSAAGVLLKDSWPLILSSISISIGMRIDQVMLKNLINETSVGYYAVGVKLAEVFTFLPMILCQSIYPKIIEMDFDKERKQIINIIRYIFFGLLFFAFIVNMFSSFALSITYGEEFSQSTIVLDILIYSIPATFLNIITTHILLKLNKRFAILSRQIVLAVINIGLNIYLIPRFGIMGAALATVLADASLFFYELFFKRLRWIFFLRIKSIFFLTAKNYENTDSSSRS